MIQNLVQNMSAARRRSRVSVCNGKLLIAQGSQNGHVGKSEAKPLQVLKELTKNDQRILPGLDHVRVLCCEPL